ncbi:hypothetical protein LIA77_07418 [Sarocladium implicatum]|nr:hypothetical protein LIA77_07418 [Sarocladium implicatum]
MSSLMMNSCPMSAALPNIYCSGWSPSCGHRVFNMGRRHLHEDLRSRSLKQGGKIAVRRRPCCSRSLEECSPTSLHLHALRSWRGLTPKLNTDAGAEATAGINERIEHSVTV